MLPCTVLLSSFQGTRLTSIDIWAAVLISLGTAVATVTDVNLTLAGTAIGLIAVVATAQSQIYQGRIQAEQKVTSTQAMYAISLPQAVLTLAASIIVETTWARVLAGGAPTPPTAVVQALRARGALRYEAPLPLTGRDDVSAALDGLDAGNTVDISPARQLSRSAAAAALAASQRWAQDIWTHPYTGTEVLYIGVTCLCALALNYSAIALIGRINAVSFQFVNQAKTVLIMAVGFLVFSEAATVPKLTGFLMSCGTIIWYTYAKQRK